MIKKHQHKFRRIGMTLYCSCGFCQTIECAHLWKLDSTQYIQIEKMGGSIRQTREVRICKRCGAIANLNTTTGETNINH
jgi:hypothetical protein